MTMQTHHYTGRFSEGMEHAPRSAASMRIGSFADGMATTVTARVGSFADGLALHPEAPAARRIGTFGDTQPPARTLRPRLRVGRATPQPA
jgi:hypothetical protein